MNISYRRTRRSQGRAQQGTSVAKLADNLQGSQCNPKSQRTKGPNMSNMRDLNALRKKAELGYRATRVDRLCENARAAMAEHITLCETGDDIIDVQLNNDGAVLLFGPGGGRNIVLQALNLVGYGLEEVELNGLFMRWPAVDKALYESTASSWSDAPTADLSVPNDYGIQWLSRRAARNRPYQIERCAETA